MDVHQEQKEQQQQQRHPFKKTEETDVTVIVKITPESSSSLTNDNSNNNNDDNNDNDGGILQLYAHKSILSFYSPKFRDMIQDQQLQQYNETMATITMTGEQNETDVIEFFKFFYPEHRNLIEIDLGEL